MDSIPKRSHKTGGSHEPGCGFYSVLKINPEAVY
jgi:hypothetical protein